jgi:hypothetical protein
MVISAFFRDLCKDVDSTVYIYYRLKKAKALGPTQWVPVALYLGVKQPGCEADHSPPSSAEDKEYVELYLHSPNTPSWCGAQLKKSTGTTLNYKYKC